jgi:hypothetical protein
MNEGARQRRADCLLHRSYPGASGIAGRLAQAAGRGHAGRVGRDPRHPRRQPGLHGAGRRAVRQGARQGQGLGAPRAASGRDLGTVPVARARGAFPGVVERRSGVRRDGVDRPAADRASLRREDGARGDRGADEPAGEDVLRGRPRVLEGQAGGGFRGGVAQGAARRRHRGERVTNQGRAGRREHDRAGGASPSPTTRGRGIPGIRADGTGGPVPTRSHSL